MKLRMLPGRNENKLKIKEKIEQNKWEFIITIIYGIITFIIAIIFHEKWRDEAQAWMIARDLDIIGIIKQMAYEGHPPLWHFILFPFAKLGFPYITQSIISWIIMVFSAWLLLTKSPFRIETKILILLSAPVLYWYTACSRSYCLIFLAISLIAIFYPQRKEKPVQYSLSILLLAYTHVLMLGVVGILYLFFFIDQLIYLKKLKANAKKTIIAFSIAVIGLGLLVLMLMGSINTNKEVYSTSIFSINANSIFSLIEKIQYEFFGSINISKGFQIYFGLGIIITLIWLGIENIENMLILVIGVAWQLYIYLMIYGTSVEKSSTLIFISILVFWITLNGNKKENERLKHMKQMVICCVIVFLSLNSMEGISKISADIHGNFSYSKEAAQYIKNNIDKDAIFVCTENFSAASITPYVDNMKLWNPNTEEYFTYVTWDGISNKYLPIEEIIQKAKSNFNKGEKVYLIESIQTNIADKEKIVELQSKNVISKELYRSQKAAIAKEEQYIIYKINL